MSPDRNGVLEALRSLDREPAPDLWPEIVRRSESSTSVTELRRPTRVPRLLAAAAALVVVIAVAAAVIRLSDSSDTGRQDPAAPTATVWSVDARIPVPDLGPGPRVMTAAGDSAWVGGRGGQLVAVARDGSSAIETTIPVPPIAALAAHGDVAWLLDTDGTLHRVERDGAVDLVAELGRSSTSSVQPLLASAGDSVWASGTDAGRLVRVDADGSVQVSDLDIDPELLTGTDRALWAVLDGGRQVVRIDLDSAEVVERTATEGVTMIAASGDRVWLLHSDTGGVDRIDGRGEPRPYATISPATTGIAVVGDRFWVNESGLFTGLDLASGRPVEELSVGNVIGAAMTTDARSLWALESTPELVRVAPG